jgi:AcrR family transcriptional regulator
MQFADKTELFAAVVEDVEADVVERLAAQVVADPKALGDPLSLLEQGIDAWLDASAQPEVQRIVLLDAPGVLGWQRWRATGLRYAGVTIRPPEPVHETRPSQLDDIHEADDRRGSRGIVEGWARAARVRRQLCPGAVDGGHVNISERRGERK